MSRYWNDFNAIDISSDEYLEHFGIKGQKWGLRRYQNEDGSLTSAGAARYSKLSKKYAKATQKSEKYSNKANKAYYKAGGILGRTLDGYAESKFRKQAKYDRKSLKQNNKAYKYKKKIEKLMKETGMSLDDVLEAVGNDAVAKERVRMMFA